ncbi:hypothetical protein [Streptomyces sp. TRM64462]|uniref:hypothetical protein n=1 Tax=Streptomyces sp. TRM64462 TaxID=2741726 RepID=UPI001586F219|nr:hypothetical protein [Streptomyces sp. TRM64462]
MCRGGRAIDLPMVGGPIAIGYHLDGVDDLVLDAVTLARMRPITGRTGRTRPGGPRAASPLRVRTAWWRT